MRTRYVLAYDISDPSRWRRIYRIARDFGDPLQFSVFLCDLSDKDKAVLQQRVEEVVSRDDDQVVLIRLRPTEDIWDLIDFIGRPPGVVDRKALIY